MSPRLIIVSNRVVAPEEADSSLADEMAATVKAALKNQNGMWFGWSGKMTDQPASEPRTHQVNKVTYAQIDLSRSDIQEYCDGLANSVLWPILHCRVDLQQYSRTEASGYMRVNQLYADHLSALMNADDVVWVLPRSEKGSAPSRSCIVTKGRCNTSVHTDECSPASMEGLIP
jgi:trehalose 6-phosphate synthase